MSNWSADYELTVACKVGSLANVKRALEEGANVNHGGGEPLFVAIMDSNREIVDLLLRAGADVSMFVTKTRLKKLKTDEDKLEALMECAPPSPEPEDSDKEPATGEDDGEEAELAALNTAKD